MPEQPRSVTRLLMDWRRGDRQAFDRLVPEVYDELRRLATRQMRGERGRHTIQPTALVNEAYVRLVDAQVDWQDRAHFFAVAARQMRRILIDHARARHSAKRGGEVIQVTLTDSVPAAAEPTTEMLALEDALVALEQRDARKARIIELYFFAGMTQAEIAETLDLSVPTVGRDLRFANAWLRTELRPETPDGR